MQNIIFLDDDKNRTATFLDRLKKSSKPIHTAETANDLIEIIKTVSANPENSILMFLDHDLGGEIYVDSNREDCGMEVVRWIVANKVPNVEQIIIHTHNTPAGLVMEDKLLEAGYQVVYLPFASLIGQIEVDG